MRKNGFTLIELLAVIVILAIIALIATPIILGIINDAREESNERSVELYASAIKNGIAAHQLRTGNEVLPGTYNETNKLPFEPDYEGNVECTSVIIGEDGKVSLEGCTVNGGEKEYSYGIEEDSDVDSEPVVPTPVSFADDDWSTIVANIKAGNLSKYNVGETREISLNGFTNNEPDSDGKYTIRIANTSTPSECSTEGYSQTACGFVIEFEDIIIKHKMNETETNAGGYPASLMYTYIQNDIYNALPEELKAVIIPTYVVSGHGKKSGEKNFITEQDKLYLLSAKEVYGLDSSDTSSGLTRQLEYYKDVAKVTTSSYSGAIKTLDGTAKYWWLRSAYSHDSHTFRSVDNDGSFSNYYANYAPGVAVAFRIG